MVPDKHLGACVGRRGDASAVLSGFDERTTIGPGTPRVGQLGWLGHYGTRYGCSVLSTAAEVPGDEVQSAVRHCSGGKPVVYGGRRWGGFPCSAGQGVTDHFHCRSSTDVRGTRDPCIGCG